MQLSTRRQNNRINSKPKWNQHFYGGRKRPPPQTEKNTNTRTTCARSCVIKGVEHHLQRLALHWKSVAAAVFYFGSGARRVCALQKRARRLSNNVSVSSCGWITRFCCFRAIFPRPADPKLRSLSDAKLLFFIIKNRQVTNRRSLRGVRRCGANKTSKLGSMAIFGV